MENENINSVNAEQTGTVDQPQTTEPEQSTEQPVNAGNGEATTPAADTKPAQTPEENAKYAAIRREYQAKMQTETQKAAQKAKDDFIASQRYEWNGKPITTEAEYQQALQEKELQDKGIDPSLINDVINNNPMVKQAHEMLTKQQQQDAKNAEYMDFLTAYPDVKPEEVTPETWELNNKGIPLKYAYAAAQETKNLKDKLSQYEKGQATQTVNGKNAATSTGSVTGSGVNQTYYTREQVEGMSVSEVNKHYNEIMNSAKTWK